jgi:hypothetical protein
VEKINNIDVAVLQRVNELVSRYGFEPTDLIVTYGFDSSDDRDKALRFENPPPDTMWSEFNAMLTSIGIGDKSGQGEEPSLRGPSSMIYVALGNALRKAPRGRG